MYVAFTLCWVHARSGRCLDLHGATIVMSFFQAYTTSVRRSGPFHQRIYTPALLLLTFHLRLLQFPENEFVVAQMDYMDAAVKVRL